MRFCGRVPAKGDGEPGLEAEPGTAAQSILKEDITMRKLISVILLVTLLFSLAATALAETTEAQPEAAEEEQKTYNTPFLITNAGQGPGGKMARLLVTQTGVLVLDEDFFYDSEPGAEGHGTLDDMEYPCLVVVIGSTDKGLGASGITIEDELARLEKMVAHAEEINLPIVAVLLEKDKRSDIPTNANERCIDAICPHAEWMIVVADGNADGRFDKLSEEYDIPLTVIDTTLDFTALAKEAFVKAE